MEKEYEVATYWWPDHKTGEYKNSGILCYIKYRNPESAGNEIVYKVRAINPAYAKRIARRIRYIDGP
jgi:hypothetical protein